MSETKKDWKENLRLFTPFLLVIISIIGWVIREQVGDVKSSLLAIQCQVTAIDEKMFKHLTNDEIHIPRSTVVNKSEFDLYQKMRDKQMDSMEGIVRDIRNIVKDGK